MKISNNTIKKLLLSVIMLIYFSGTYCKAQNSESDEPLSKIDSLIQTHRLNEKCLMLNFGSEAVTAINSNKGIVVIDAGMSTTLTAKYKKIFADEFQRDDFIYIINTHSHPDHIRGNSIFNSARIVGHINCLQEISKQWKNPEKLKNTLNNIVEEYDFKLRTSELNTEEWKENFIKKVHYYNAYIDERNLTRVREPDFTFSDSLTIDLGDITIEMFYFGNCHSTSDILIYIPQMNILFTGDLFFKYGGVSINNNLTIDKTRWLNSVKWIEERIPGMNTIISGHGKFLSINDLKYCNENILEKLKQ